MGLKELIDKLQEIYDTHTIEEKLVVGEPEIMIDVFRHAPGHEHLFEYTGFDRDIEIEASGDGVYHILSRFPPDK